MTNGEHSAECLAQNANTLFGEPGPCICPPRKSTRTPNPCYGAELVDTEVPTEHWQVHLPFSPSGQQLARYQEALNATLPKSRQHRPVKVREGEGYKVSWGDDAIATLCDRHPKDVVYAAVPHFRILQKALGTYLYKLRPTLADGRRNTLLGDDGRLHDPYRHTPVTLRLSREILQVLPRPTRGGAPAGDPRRIYDAIRRCFVPALGCEFIARDFSGIEPLLVAYCAKDAQYLRACKLGSHDWFTSFVIGKPLDLSLPDADVAAAIQDLASGGPYLLQGEHLPWKAIRDGCKTTHMASLYAGGPGEIARANRQLFESAKDAAYYQDLFFDLVPSVKTWHWDTAERAERDGYLTTPTGFRLHYFGLFDHRKSVKTGRWTKYLSRVAKEAIAAVPQHLGMMYLATAAVALAREYPEMAAWMRLLIHDEILSEVPVERADEADGVLASVMERPHPLMPLWDEAAKLVGETHLSVKTEGKRSRVSWGEMS